ncbi:MAG TPA: L,D-transpeptidase family protein [Xanthobacteraceae bacterium]|nr:L,D-transpeptidase family protein [Xanthobacteraceae bacterium]
MPGVRLDRFLASTAIVVLLSATAGGGVADPMGGGDTSVPAVTAAPATEGNSGQAAAKREGPADEAPAPDASAKPNQSDTAAKPHQSGEQPAAAAAAPPAKADQATGQPASTAAAPATPAKPEQATDQPAAPATTVATPSPAPASNQDQAAEKPAAPGAAAIPSQQPAGAAGENGAPTTATMAPAAAAPAPVADGNTPIAEQLRGLAGGKFDRIIGGKKDRATIDAFYSGRDYAPLWLSDGKPNAKAKAAIAYLGQVDTDGLDPADYPVPDFTSLTDPAALAEAEMRLTTSIITYAHHAQIGRVHWTRVSGDIFYDQKAPEPADILAAIVDAKDIAQVLDGYEPHAPGYLALKAKLAELRAGKDSAAHAQIPTGPTPKIGAQDDRVPQLRERLGLPADSDTTYDKTLAAAVKKFQQERELKPTGTLTAATVDALNGRQPDRPIDTIIANLERWRWIPHDLGKSYVMVNLPDFTLRVFHDGKQVWMTRIVDGKPAMPTPIMTAEMKYITVNPTWNVPPSIVAKEYLPALAQDPTVLERMGLQVSHNPDGTIHISQPPGDRNALGRLRFNFPNKFLVYQHDTPDKNLFALDRRAFSHGCMRVQDPAKYAQVLLSIVRPGDGYTEDRIRRMFGSGEQDIQFPKFLPVHLTYQTAFVDDDGKLEFREDIYGRDKTLLAILKGDERKVADIAISRPENTVRREALAMPGGYYGDNFFSRLFGGGFNAPQPQQQQTSRRYAPAGAQRRTESQYNGGGPSWFR